MKSMRYAVIGIGNYGSRIALEMAGGGGEVCAIECVEEKVEEVSDDVALAVTLDSTDPKALRSQRLEEMDAAVVAIGDNFEATVLTTLSIVVATALYAVGAWGQVSFSELDPVFAMRIVVPSVTAMVLGLQIIFSSLFYSILGLTQR